MWYLTLLAMLPLILASAFVAGASLFDGITTVKMLNAYSGYFETNPLFGKHPSTKRIFLEGIGLVAGEIALAFTANHWSSDIGLIFAAAFLAQGSIHIFDGRHNLDKVAQVKK
jgi:hypothetical protein